MPNNNNNNNNNGNVIRAAIRVFGSGTTTTTTTVAPIDPLASYLIGDTEYISRSEGVYLVLG